MRILISGSHGFIGKALCPFLERKGHEIVHLMRKKQEDSHSITWDPMKGEINKDDFEGFDAVIHLAGKNIGDARWSKRFKQTIFQSRCRDTWLLSEVLRRLHRPPKILITASAVGFYGDCGQKTLTEDCSQGSGFLADVCEKWEQATSSVEKRGVRVVHARLGMVLSEKGGVLKKLLPLYKRGFGPILGSGKQYVSWVAMKDLLNIFHFLLLHEDIEGAVNVVAPFPVMQKEFVETFSKLFGKKAWITIPAWMVELLTGQMGKEVLLASQKAYPSKLIEKDYVFTCPTLESVPQTLRGVSLE